MRVLWDLFEITVNFFQGFIMVYFEYYYLGDKRGHKFLKSSGVLFGIGLAILISLLNCYMMFENLFTLFYIVVMFVYALMFLGGNFIRKIFASVFPMVISLVSSAFVSNFTALLFRTNLYNIISQNSIDRFVTVTAVQLMITYLVIISLRTLKKKENDKNTLAFTEWIFILSVLVISIIIGAFLNMLSLEGISHNSRRYLVFSLAGIILINVVVCYLVVDLGRKNNAIRENELLRLQQEYNKQYIENADMEYDLIRKIRHDFKDNYSAIYTLLLDGNVTSAIRHIEKNLDALVKTETFVHTDNDIVNAVINTKLSAARSFGIEAICLSVSDFNDVEDIDLCRLLSNMLENAITACITGQRDKKQIYLKISSDEYKYIFNLKNTIDESVLTKNPYLRTIKKDKDVHGYGTKIIRDIARKYQGKCDFYEEDSFFCCSVTLKK
ncbi:MAG: GHKL domain-containing protein [Ruminococcus flavefaciens]|nr:GHKL domain-containing protein [Ruminococcus flavefaciens]MCM1361290.1 GHKL domain-containing protein [Clostridiales bacterium]